MDAEKLRAGREKLTRVFRYLEALNQHPIPRNARSTSSPGVSGCVTFLTIPLFNEAA